MAWKSRGRPTINPNSQRLIPEDPMPYFWKGVAMRNLCISMQAKDSGEKDAGMIDLRNAFRHFIKIAPQEGRKVCQTWWDLALVEVQQLSCQPSLSTETKFTVGDTYGHRRRSSSKTPKQWKAWYHDWAPKPANSGATARRRRQGACMQACQPGED